MSFSNPISQVEDGIGVYQADEFGLTPLMVASGLGDLPAVDALLRAGADVHALEPRMGATALHKAAQSGDPDTIGILLDHGAFIDRQSPTLGHTALIDAVLHKHEAAVRTLLVRGAKLGIRTHYDMTALDLARADRHSVITELIEAEQKRIETSAASQALAAVVKTNQAGRVRALIAAGADINELTPVRGTLDDGYTPLGLAARDGHVEIVRILLDAGADITRLNGLMRATAGHEAAYMGHADVARMLVQHRADGVTLDIDSQGAYNGYTALHDAVWQGHAAVAIVLTEAGARLDLEDHTGLTARELASRLGHEDLARYLLEAEQRPHRGL